MSGYDRSGIGNTEKVALPSWSLHSHRQLTRGYQRNHPDIEVASWSYLRKCLSEDRKQPLHCPPREGILEEQKVFPTPYTVGCLKWGKRPYLSTAGLTNGEGYDKTGVLVPTWTSSNRVLCPQSSPLILRTQS